METLKPLSDITTPDRRHLRLGAARAEIPEELRPPDLEDLHAQASKLELPPAVPETIRSAFAVARTLWVYGWYYWPFHTLAGAEAFRCIEMALKQRCEAEGLFGRVGGKRKDKATLKWLFDRALDQGWLVDEGFANFRRFRRGESSFFVVPGTIRTESQDQPLEEPDPRAYSRRLAESLRISRNHHAHPEGHWHGMPSWGFFDLEFAYDLIVQLFPTE